MPSKEVMVVVGLIDLDFANFTIVFDGNNPKRHFFQTKKYRMFREWLCSIQKSNLARGPSPLFQVHTSLLGLPAPYDEK